MPITNTSPHQLETVTGKFVDLLNPDPNDICIEDIAWSLSRLARYNGHTIQRLPYSVGQHCIHVAKYVKDLIMKSHQTVAVQHMNRKMLQSLLHDAGEAYTGDISGPLKKIPELRPIIKGIEKKIDIAIFTAFDIPMPTHEDELIIKNGDMIAQRVESYNFMVSRGMSWIGKVDVSIVELQDFEMPKPSIEVYHEYLEMFHDLRGKL